MDRKEGTVFLLLLCCSVLAASVKIKSNSKITEAARQLMKKCEQMGFEQPDIDKLHTLMGSDVPAEEKNADPPNTSLLSMFAKVLESVTVNGSSSFGKTGSRRFNTTSFKEMISKMNKLPEASRCYLGAVMAPVSWDTITKGDKGDMSPEEFKQYVQAAQQGMESPPRKLRLPKKISMQNMKILVEMLRQKYSSMSKQQCAQVMRWVKKQTTSKSKAPKEGKRVEWLTTTTVNLLGPYISCLPAADIELAPQKGLCEFFRSEQFEPIVDRLNPLRGKKLVNKIKACTNFSTSLDKLGRLVCYYDPPELTMDTDNTTLLSKISQCPGLAKLKKRLLATVDLKADPEMMENLGNAVRFIPKAALAQFSKKEVAAVLKTGAGRFTRKQLRVLCKTYLENTECRELTQKELQDLRPALRALPGCFWKKTMHKLKDDADLLKDMSQNIGKSKALALARVLLEKKNDLDQMDKFSDKILQAVPVKAVKKAKITSWKMIIRMKWRCAQAIYLAKKMKETFKTWYRNPGSLICGITCKMIENVDPKNVLEMSQGLADSRRRIPKVLAKCAAQKLFSTLEKQRKNYFKTVTAEELSAIPTVFLIELSPGQIKALPDSLCQEFLDKMEEADLRTLPELSPSRSALKNRALGCLGSDLSTVDSEDMERLGSLLCEVSPAKLKLLKPEVQRESLQTLAKCDFIPEENREGVLQLVSDVYGDTENWTDATMDELGPLLVLDGKERPLPKKPWLKYFILEQLQSKIGCVCNFLKKLLFDLIVSEFEPENPPTVSRPKREATKPKATPKPDPKPDPKPTPELISELGAQNSRWTPAQLEDMSLDTFKETVETLGDVKDFSKEQLQELRKKAIKVWGAAQSMNESEVAQLGCLAQGFSADELKSMAFSQSSLSDLAECGWTEAQVAAVWKGASKHNNVSAESLDASDLVDLDRFLCGLTPKEIQLLNTSAFSDALASINKVRCPAGVLPQFKDFTVEAFGKPRSWTEEEVSELGTFVAALNASELSSLDVSVFPYFSEDSIPLIPPPNLAALSPAQIAAFGSDNAAKVTAAQKAGLNQEQLDALKRATQGIREQNQSGSGSSRAAERMSLSMFLLPFLFVGLVLL